ncbi:MAG: 2-hydroxyacyl-CoA dehydratase family protein [Dehalococcoidia bacterium]
MTALDELRQPAATLTNPYIERWREKGGKVVGYYCTYVPAEIIHAAGMFPYRMRATGSTSSDLGDVYTYRTMCTYCRHSLDQAMRGEYKFLDGLVAFYSCDHVRRLYDIWKAGKVQPSAPPFYFHFLSMPMKADKETEEWLAGGLKRFVRSLEDDFQVTITDEALRRSIELYNEKRRLLMSLYEMRKQDAPPISGTEVLEILIASTSMQVEEFNQLLKRVLEELRGRDGFSDYRARLLLGGGELEDPEYVKLIEDLGGLVVTDFMCFGVRDFWDLVDEDAEPISAMARRYLERVSCPRMIDHPRRQEFLMDLAKEFKVDGIIIQRMKYCDTWGGESAMMEWDIKKESSPTPYMVLEREYLMGAVGQMRTRVQAFLETIGR